MLKNASAITRTCTSNQPNLADTIYWWINSTQRPQQKCQCMCTRSPHLEANRHSFQILRFQLLQQPPSLWKTLEWACLHPPPSILAADNHKLNLLHTSYHAILS